MKNNHNFGPAWEGLFIQHRPFLVSFAFRMTGSLAEAEDLVQDTFLECVSVDPESIKNHKSWLTKVCSNKSLDHLKSAYKRRETYPGTWLPDAVPDSYQFWGNLQESDAPDKSILISESLSTSFLLLIEKLNPEERVVYLLNEVFDYSFKEISEFLNKSEDACRKIAQRARQGISSSHLKFDSTKSNSQKLITDFFEQAKSGDGQKLFAFLSDESEFWSDGGGKVSAAKTIFKTIEQIARFFASPVMTRVYDGEGFKLEYVKVNGLPGLVISKALPDGLWGFETIMSFEIKDNKIVRIYAQRNPDKFESLLRRPI